MKLPADKKERMKVLILIAIGTLGVLYAIIQMGIRPFLKSRKDMETKIVELREEIEKAEKEIRRVAGVRDQNYEVLKKLNEISDKYMLEAHLGIEFDIPASDLLDRLAKQASLPRAAYQKTRIIGFPAMTPVGQQNDADLYVAQYNLECGYNELVHFLKVVEDHNPYAHVNNITIGATDNVTNSTVSFQVQLPKWKDQKLPSRIEAQMKEIEESRGVDKEETDDEKEGDENKEE